MRTSDTWGESEYLCSSPLVTENPTVCSSITDLPLSASREPSVTVQGSQPSFSSELPLTNGDAPPSLGGPLPLAMWQNMGWEGDRKGGRQSGSMSCSLGSVIALSLSDLRLGASLPSFIQWT